MSLPRINTRHYECRNSNEIYKIKNNKTAFKTHNSPQQPTSTMAPAVETDKSNEFCLCLQISLVMTFLGLIMNMNQSLLIYESIFESCHEYESIYSYMTYFIIFGLLKVNSISSLPKESDLSYNILLNSL